MQQISLSNCYRGVRPQDFNNPTHPVRMWFDQRWCGSWLDAPQGGWRGGAIAEMVVAGKETSRMELGNNSLLVVGRSV
jgi:hypothetical protein